MAPKLGSHLNCLWHMLNTDRIICRCGSRAGDSCFFKLHSDADVLGPRFRKLLLQSYTFLSAGATLAPTVMFRSHNASFSTMVLIVLHFFLLYKEYKHDTFKSLFGPA